MDKINLEYILWSDTWSHDPWDAVEDISDNEYLVHTYGQVIKETENIVMVALNYAPSEHKASCVAIIPKSCIKQRYQIEGYGRDKIRDDV